MGDCEVGAERRYAVTVPTFQFEPGLSVFFPAFNDAPSLPALLERTFETLRRVAADYEVIVVNDGSTDNTGTVLEDLRQQYAPHMRVITHATNRGYGAALRTGFQNATKDYVFYTDGDSQYDPAELEDLLRAVGPKTGLVNGYKIERSDPWHRVAIGWLYNKFARWLFQIRLRDIDCDFRLIRRNLMDVASLRSTGGTICVELVRTLEMSGAEVVELPVHHYARQYGRSQFFRIRSLAVTFFQLCAVFYRLVMAAAIAAGEPSNRDAPGQLSQRHAALVAISVLVLAALAYGRALWLPFIADDYLQIQLARDYGPVSKWGTLAQDALYRCRATSLVLTYWLDRAIGLAPFYYNLVSLLLHVADSLLVFALGMWRPVGWKVAGLAACFFAVSQRHSEAVVWFSAVPELLVFFFVVSCFLFWIRWLEKPVSQVAYVGAVSCYLLALVSKESAVVAAPLCALAVLVHPAKPMRKLWGLAPFAIIAGFYFAMGYSARESHLHFHDGTFSLNAPFAKTLLRSLAGLLWFWGFVSLPLLFNKTSRAWRSLAMLAVVWMAVTLMPYSFLTYMPRVPSRHTYMASIGLSLIVAAGILAFRQHTLRWKRIWMVPSVACLIVVHQSGYLWTVKHRQYEERAQPTEDLITVASQGGTEIHAACFPYAASLADIVLRLKFRQRTPPIFMVGTLAAKQPDAVDFCNSTANGIHY